MQKNYIQLRGRPKGTGIDDWKSLVSIADLIRKNPELRVTTAIKELGFEEPSTIRRLRDKFKRDKGLLFKTLKNKWCNENYCKLSASASINIKNLDNIFFNTNTNIEKTSNRYIYFKKAQDALEEYAYIADSQSSLLSGFKANIARTVLNHRHELELSH
ncbi:MAG: hypothetical protein TECD_00085 [Hyphomicrobiaceae bacterium hypho_1]